MKLDFTIYRQEKRMAPRPGVVFEIKTVATKSKLPIGIQEQIEKIPDVADISIYNRPYMVRLWYNAPPKLRSYLYVHYSLKSDGMRVGCGRVAIYDRKSGKPVYNGDDGME